MIWGMILQPGQAYTEIIQDEVHLSMATMESRGCLGLKSDNYSHVMLKTSSAEYLLCTLVGGVTYQQSLDLKLMPNDNVTFSVQGTNVVYLTGYSYMPAEISTDGGNQTDDWIEEPSLNASIPHGSDEMPGADNQGPGEISEMEPSYFPTVDQEDHLQEREEGDESFSVEYTEDQSDYQQESATGVEASVNARIMKGPSTTPDSDQTTQSLTDNTVADVELLAVKEEIHTIVDTTEDEVPSQTERDVAAEPVNLPSTSTGPIHREIQGSRPKLRSRQHPQCKWNRSTFGTNNIPQYHYRQQDEQAEARFTQGHTRHQIPAGAVPQIDGSHGDKYRRSGEQRPLKCKFCNATFAFPSKLKIHETKHTGEKRYQCEICGKKFAQLSNKMTHSSIHTGARPYKCKYCTKSFRLQSALTVHNRIHTGERPFVCSICGSAFKQHGHLREHKKTHLKS